MATQVMTITGYDHYCKDEHDFTKIFVRADVDPSRGGGFSTSALNFGTSANKAIFASVHFPLQAEVETSQYSDGKGGFKKPVAISVKVLQPQKA